MYNPTSRRLPFTQQFHNVVEKCFMEEGLLVSFSSSKRTILFLNILWHHFSLTVLLLTSLTTLASFFHLEHLKQAPFPRAFALAVLPIPVTHTSPDKFMAPCSLLQEVSVQMSPYLLFYLNNHKNGILSLLFPFILAFYFIHSMCHQMFMLYFICYVNSPWLDFRRFDYPKHCCSLHDTYIDINFLIEKHIR